MSKHRYPNLFLIGAMKAGTTSLHEYLAAHPEIFMCSKKEPRFFADETSLAKGENWYLNLFGSARDEVIVGESSTAYSRSFRFPGVPERIARFNPEARIMYVMRDPVARTISHYWFQVRFFHEKRDMLTAFREDPKYTDASNYALQLAPYVRLFGSDNVATLTSEELSTNTLLTVQRLFRWLGVESSFKPPSVGLKLNITPDTIILRQNPRLNRVLDSAIGQKLKLRVPPTLTSFAKRVFCRYEYLDRNSQPIENAIEFLRSSQLEQVAALRDLVGRDFPEWRMLWREE